MVVPIGDGDGESGEPPVDNPTTDPNATPTNTRVVQTPVTTATVEMTPTLPPETVPESGGVLPVTKNNFLPWIGGALLLVLLIYGALYRLKPLSGDSQK